MSESQLSAMLFFGRIYDKKAGKKCQLTETKKPKKLIITQKTITTTPRKKLGQLIFVAKPFLDLLMLLLVASKKT